jgi:AcrR family transcriptional regulator
MRAPPKIRDSLSIMIDERPSATPSDGPDGAERTYDNRRRAAQAAENRQRIVDAAVALLAERVEDVTVPLVAERAGVSVPTVYRNFPARDDLLTAVDAALVHSIGAPPRVEGMEGLPALAITLHGHFGRNVEVLRAAARRPGLDEVRSAGRRSRDRDMERVVAEGASHLPEEDAQALAALLRVLIGTESFLVLHDRLGLSPDRSGRAVAWAVECLCAGAAQARGLQPTVAA